MLKKRLDRVVRQVTHALVKEFYNTEMLPEESGAKFVNRVKSAMKQI